MLVVGRSLALPQHAEASGCCQTALSPPRSTFLIVATDGRLRLFPGALILLAVREGGPCAHLFRRWPGPRQDGEVTPTRAQTVADIMRTAPWLTLDDLLRKLGGRGLPTTTEQFTEVWRDPAIGNLAQIDVVDPPLVVNLPAVLVGRVFTHQLSAKEIERDELATVPDFAGIWPLLDVAPFDQLDAKRIQDAIDEVSLEPVIRLSPGTLAGYPAQQLIAITVTPAGLHLEAAPEPRATGSPSSRSGSSTNCWKSSATTFAACPSNTNGMTTSTSRRTCRCRRSSSGAARGRAEQRDDTEPVGAIPLEEYLLLACVRHPELFTEPGWPVKDILERQQLDHEDGMVAVAGFDFAAANEVAGEIAELERISETYEVSDSESRAVLAFTDKVTELHDAIHEWVDGGEGEEDFPDFDVVTVLPHCQHWPSPWCRWPSRTEPQW